MHVLIFERIKVKFLYDLSTPHFLRDFFAELPRSLDYVVCNERGNTYVNYARLSSESHLPVLTCMRRLGLARADTQAQMCGCPELTRCLASSGRGPWLRAGI